MKSEFLSHLREHVDSLRAKLHVLANPPASRNPRPIDPVHVASAEEDASKILATIDTEISRGRTSQEFETQMLDTAPHPGETPEQTTQRLKAENWDNPLVARHTGQ